MARSTKKSVTVPNPVREGLVAQIKDGTLDYPSENSAWIGLARYQLLIGKPHPVTSAIARMHAADQDVIDDFLHEIAVKGLTLRGQFLSHLIDKALGGTIQPNEQETANLLPQELLRMDKEWRRNPGPVLESLRHGNEK
jgi:hypothetical protein